MPVGIVLVVDQSLIQDVLLAFANSPLRFQITQVVWTSFTGKLEGTAPAAGSTGDGGVDFGSGTVNVAGPSDPDSRPGPMGLGTPMPGALFPGGRRPLGPGSITLPFGAGGAPGSTPFGSPFGGAGSPYGRQASTVSESQITSGLVELSIYGIVSLYEKYDPQKPAEGAAGPATTPTTTAAPKEVTQPKEPKDAKEPKEPKDAKEPMPKEPTPKQPAKEPMPMATEPTPPAKKMRRRR
jgi:hypothetical protein